MIRWFPLLKNFPKWFVTVLIGVIGCGIFTLWWVTHRGKSAVQSSTASSAGDVSAGSRLSDLRPDECVLCGNTLVNFKTGEVAAKQWLEGIGDSAPPVVRVLPNEKLVICGNRGNAGAFSFSGAAKPPLKLEAKSLSSAGFSFADSRAIFIREGNLWQGHVDWLQSSVVDAKRVTDTGFFRDDVFRGAWFWYGQKAFVLISGKTHQVDLTSGAVTPANVDVGAISYASSPDGKKSATPLSIGNFEVFDFERETTKKLPIRGNFRLFAWLDADRLAYVSAEKEVSVFDAGTGEVKAFACPAVPLKLASPSSKGECLLIGTNVGPMMLHVADGKFSKVDLPMEDGTWISETGLLCMNSSTDTTVRGIWRVNVDGTKEKVAGRPPDTSRAATGGNPMIAIPGGSLWVSEGNLWSYDIGSSSVKQLTQDQHLPPVLQLLPK